MNKKPTFERFSTFEELKGIKKPNQNKTDNELIAEFMGVETDGEGNYNSMTERYPLHMQLEYNTSWDWLMPVVEKISSLYKVEPHDIEEFCAVINITINTPISEVYLEVVEFIKWYNDQNQ